MLGMHTSVKKRVRSSSFTNAIIISLFNLVLYWQRFFKHMVGVWLQTKQQQQKIWPFSLIKTSQIFCNLRLKLKLKLNWG